MSDNPWKELPSSTTIPISELMVHARLRVLHEQNDRIEAKLDALGAIEMKGLGCDYWNIKWSDYWPEFLPASSSSPSREPSQATESSTTSSDTEKEAGSS